jgi:hypothetical protein
MSNTSAGDILRSLFSGRSIEVETQTRIKSEEYIEGTKQRAPRVYLLSLIMTLSVPLAVIFVIPAAAWLYAFWTGGEFVYAPPLLATAIACIGMSLALPWLVLGVGAVLMRDRSAIPLLAGAVAHGIIASVGVLSLMNAA